ncbi:hypothetical protein F5Y09DRAFT_354326 [Xylaria sp. FL1042]|nr:hypothetical protein F5Y09DRAFT_354326 [Xylaria sp. FL1042]
MAGKDSSTRPADNLVLAAMMDDLGNHRMEELAREDNRVSHRRQAFVPYATGHVRAIQAQKSGVRLNNPAEKDLAEMYKEAVQNGEFDDDDAAAVKKLDPLDNGNAHRLNRSAFQQSRQFRTEAPGHDVTVIPKRPIYDPSQASYARKNRLRNLDPNANRPRVASLGGIGPDGGEVKRWNPGRSMNGANPVDNRLTRSAGRGYPISSQNDPPLVPIQVPGHGHGRDAPPPSFPQTTENGRQAPNNHPKEVACQGHGKPTQPLRTPMNGVSATTSELRVPRSALLQQTTPTGSAAKTVPKPSRETLQARASSGRSSSWVPPHLRKACENETTALQSHTLSRQASPPLSQLSTEIAVSCGRKYVSKIVSLDAQEIFFEDNIYMQEYDGAIINKPTKGRIAIYELLYSPVCIWELTIEEKGKVIRGDIRELLEVLPNGSEVYLRRCRGDGKVRSNPLRFSGINEAKKFISEAKLRRDQYARSSETIYTETTVDLSPADYATTHQTTGGSVNKTTPGAAVPASSGQNLDTPDHKLPETRERTLMESGPGEHKMADVKHGTRPRTLLISFPEKSTPPIVANSNHKRMESGSSGIVDLISFSPGPADAPSPPEEIAEPNFDQPLVDLPGLPPVQQVDSGEQTSSFMPEDAQRAETVKALRNIEAIEAVSANDQSNNSGGFLYGISEEYTLLIQRSTLLSIALDTPYPTAAFGTTLVHLAEKDEFLKMSRDDQKKSLAYVYTVVRHRDSRIIRSHEQMVALRSGKEPCPEAIKQFNAFIMEHKWGALPANHPQRSSTSDTISILADQIWSLSMTCDN